MVNDCIEITSTMICDVIVTVKPQIRYRDKLTTRTDKLCRMDY